MGPTEPSLLQTWVCVHHKMWVCSCVCGHVQVCACITEDVSRCEYAGVYRYHGMGCVGVHVCVYTRVHVWGGAGAWTT